MPIRFEIFPLLGTPKGLDGYRDAAKNGVQAQMGFKVEESHEEDGVTVIDKATITSIIVDTKGFDAAMDEAQATIDEYRQKTLVTQSVPRWWKYPTISMLMDRAAKAEKLQAAAALLAAAAACRSAG